MSHLLASTYLTEIPTISNPGEGRVGLSKDAEIIVTLGFRGGGLDLGWVGGRWEVGGGVAPNNPVIATAALITTSGGNLFSLFVPNWQ